jgi:hypothetical protein
MQTADVDKLPIRLQADFLAYFEEYIQEDEATSFYPQNAND